MEEATHPEARATWKDRDVMYKDCSGTHHRADRIWSPSYTVPRRLMRTTWECSDGPQGTDEKARTRTYHPRKKPRGDPRPFGSEPVTADRHTGSIWYTAFFFFFNEVLLEHKQPIHLHIVCSCLHARTAELSRRTATISSAKPKVFPIWLFTEKVCCLLLLSSRSQPGQPGELWAGGTGQSPSPGGHSQPVDTASHSLLRGGSAGVEAGLQGLLRTLKAL